MEDVELETDTKHQGKVYIYIGGKRLCFSKNQQMSKPGTTVATSTVTGTRNKKEKSTARGRQRFGAVGQGPRVWG